MANKIVRYCVVRPFLVSLVVCATPLILTGAVVAGVIAAADFLTNLVTDVDIRASFRKAWNC